MFYNKTEKKQYEIMLNTFSRSLIIWEPAIETRSQGMNGEPGTNWGTRTAEQFLILEIILEWMNEQFNWYENQLVHKGLQHLHVPKQATKISEIRLHYLGYKHKTQWKRKKTYTHKIIIQLE